MLELEDTWFQLVDETYAEWKADLTEAAVREDVPIERKITLFRVLCKSGCTELFLLAATPHDDKTFFKILQTNETVADLGWAEHHVYEDFMDEDEIIIWVQGSLQSFVSFTTPVNDNYPHWDNLPIEIIVPEGYVGEFPGENKEYLIKALDDDFGDNEKLTYTLNDTSGPFELINIPDPDNPPMPGIVAVLKVTRELDYETQPLYIFEVKSPRSVTVIVEDIPDESPQFYMLESNDAIEENHSAEFTI